MTFLITVKRLQFKVIQFFLHLKSKIYLSISLTDYQVSPKFTMEKVLCILLVGLNTLWVASLITLCYGCFYFFVKR